ncbi:MAG TPA: DUF115 domain-containing protein [Thermoplasmatales archaeon]|nr:DUF115 domain-containing protein [Thermoplasmatales archaeon]HEX17550.1 DUF115 domain-containing protein [Thermoplasmatales archaeon]
MDYERWKSFYRAISIDLDLSEHLDVESARLLDGILENRDVDSIIERLRILIRGKDVTVFGAGPSLKRTLRKYRSLISGTTKVSADGATTALLEEGILPDVVVTDLDGRIEDLLEADERGTIVVLHAHGDNAEMIRDYGGRFRNLIGTTQTNPRLFKNLYNFGGFTDGDRAVFLADHFGARRIYLIGFDFDGRIGRYSMSRNKGLKRKKLRWCKTLLQELDNLSFLR